MIELENVSKRYGDTHALENVSLKVLRGDIFTLMGPNGAGKTTLLRLMAGLEMPTEGTIYFDGVIVDDGRLKEVRRRSTMVFQKIALFNATVYQNVSYGLKLRPYPKNETDRAVKEALKMVRMQGFENRQAKTLSGGEQQRLSLARALTLNTDVLLLDEPTANLDPITVSIIEETISRVNQERKTTVIMATHNIFQAESLTKRAAILLDGKIAEIGSAGEVFKATSKHLAEFARVENTFSGESRVREDGTSIIDVRDGVQIESTVKRGGKVIIFVSSKDIILSREPISSSARNMFKGKIVEMSDLGSIVKLKILAGKRFTVQITKRSLVEMGLKLGSEIFLTFKASSVRII